jgi:large subunit ribosomal protein L21
MSNISFEKYAIFQSGGKQYQAIPGKTVALEKLDAEEGAEVQFPEVLLRRTSLEQVHIGQPYLDEPVIGRVVKHDRDKKVVVTKFKRRKKYHVKMGHRQPITVVRIESI